MDRMVLRALAAPERNSLVNYSRTAHLATTAGIGGLAFTATRDGWYVAVAASILLAAGALVRMAQVRRHPRADKQPIP
jgi:hypothetical protein